jgi:hypothetical protein
MNNNFYDSPHYSRESEKRRPITKFEPTKVVKPKDNPPPPPSNPPQEPK